MKSNNQTIKQSNNSHAGSALLVVLGMLAFMLFSGLAFSVYMRQSRLPTSFLRRTVATRQLAKAALAEAIEEIDTAIGNDPHPGVRASGKQFNEGTLDNFWKYRVFTAYGTSTNPEESNNSGNNNSTTYYPALVDADETVPTLTLEGLAYLPPCLINEVRYYSQRTPTAKWHSFWFDSGRYAYTAIDVSDYFDVNRIFANKPRAACGSRRISFAHLFEEGADHSSAGSKASTWDTWMESYRQVDSESDAITYNACPFVSLADFNIAFGKERCGIQNPFRNFTDATSGDPYNGASDAEDDATAEKYRCMTFVTDGWFPQPSRSSDGQVVYCCLDDPKYQPFKMDSLEKKNFRPSIDEIATYSYSDSAMQTWACDAGSNGLRLNHLNFAALWDYLDSDSVPVSLCIPTVERTPMICGLRPSVGTGDIEIPLTQSPKAGDMSGDGTIVDSKTLSDGHKWDYYSREITYTLDISKLTAAFGDVRVLMTYPFHDHGYQSQDVDTTWKLDGRFSAFLTMGSGSISPRVTDAKFTAVPMKDDFQKLEVTDKSLLSFPLSASGNITADNFKNGDADTGMTCALDQLKFQSGAPSASDLVLLKVKYTWARDRHKNDDDGNPTEEIDQQQADPLASNTGGVTVENIDAGTLFPLATTGQRADNSGDWKSFRDGKLGSATDLKLNFAVWVRLANSNGNAVDFVPACQNDDVNMYVDGKMSKCTQNCGGSGYIPLMRVVADGTLQISLANLANASPTLGKVKFPDVKWVVSDPRYNFAPENWVQITDGGALQESDWKDADWGNGKKMKEIIEERDGDGFMATSDAGYMQSVYELAFLPRVSNGFSDSERGNAFVGNLNTSYDSSSTYPTRHSDAKHADFMWKTYSPFGRYGNDEFAELENVIIPGEGTKVNPYSDSKKVLMAAFANTPHDWRVASTNDDTLFAMTADQFNKKHAWNAYSQDTTGKMCWDCLEDVAGAFKEKVRVTRDWEEAFANLGWDCSQKKILDSLEDIDSDDGDAGKLYSVDKKFLYGFWHDCFAARQQLFLIFVRAEPMMMGGGVSGQVPPQLGARAVALVWRDPTKTQNRSTDGSSTTTLANPHRTRILFYHQFD